MGRAALWLLCIAVVLGVAGGGLALTLPGRAFEAPAWVERRVEARLQELLPQHDIRVSRMRVAFEDDLRPRIGLQDVELSDLQGLTRLSLNDIDLGLSFGAVAQGQVRARDLHVSGVVVAVGRARDGTLDLSFGQGGGARAQFSDLPSALEAVTTTLNDPRLDGMERVLLDGLTIRYDDARAGRNWTVDGGRVDVTREDRDVTVAGSFAVLGGRSYVASLEAEMTTDLDTGKSRFALDVADFAAQDLATQSPALAWLDVLRAPISGTLSGEIGQRGGLSPLQASLTLGEGVVQPTEATRPIPFRSARTGFVYDPASGELQFDLLDLDSAWLSLGGRGQVLLGDIRNGLPTAYTGQFQLDHVAGTMGDVFDGERELGAANLALKVTLDPFEVKLGQAVLRDPFLPVTVRGRAAAGPDGWVYGLEAVAERLEAPRVMELWPAEFKKKTRDWVATNVPEAILSNVQFAMRNGEPGADQKVNLYLGFGFDDARVRFMKTLPPIEDGSGQFTLYDGRLAVSARGGHITAPEGGRIEVGGTEYVMPDLRLRPNPAEIALQGEGPVTAILSLLDQPPFRFLTKAGQPVTLAREGRARFEGDIALPIKPKLAPGEVTYAFSGTATGVVSDTLIKGRTLAASSLDVTVDPEAIVIAGKGLLSDVPFDGSWRQPLGKPGVPGEVKARVTLSDSGLRAFGITLPKGTLSGQGTGDLSITLGRGKAPSFALTSSLAGLGLKIPPINWQMSQGQTGEFRVAGSLGEAPKVDRLSLSAPGLKASGALDLGPNGAFKAARLDRVRAGSWLDAAVTLTSRGANATPAIRVEGARVDMRSAPFGADAGQGSGGGAAGGGNAPLAIVVEELVISEGIRLAPFQGSFTMGKGLDGSFRGKVNGRATVEGRVTPSRNGSGFELRSKDAGKALSAAGLLRRASGGALTLRMRPVADRPGHYDGALKIQNTRLTDAPAIAALLSAISVVGLIDQMAGEGIFFSDVDADFRLAPDRVTITKSSAVGPSMGISMDGIYRMKDGYMDMQGVVSPIYLLNGIGAIFSRNREGLFGFHYWIKGTAANPKVGVNPMSILTPGMFRDLFRKPPPKVK
ncbi:hypothetical protein ATO11_14665 [Pseudaestuariivita atlantica]|uniref:AsmA-like C-terminal domain-containing protein n=2 Tax=Pseudaestuariivita atlantica TaxID=1317121 RepID=A0A0L1JNY8_9RHOB|nr:hypothetical protein ATO11_14665 [Pseudaestuariivita atlantica]